MPTAESILKTLIELIEDQEQVTITYELTKGADINERADAVRTA